MFSKKETTKVFAVMLLSVFMFSLIAGVLTAGQLVTDPDTGVTTTAPDAPASSAGTTPAAQAASDAASKVAEKAKTVGEKLQESLISLFTLEKIADKETRNAISKFLLMALLALLIYAIGDAMPFIKDKSFIKGAIAVVVSVLAFIFVKDVSAITQIMYEPLGIALVSIIPLVVIIAFTLKLRDEDPKIAFFVNKVVIILFILIMLINAVRGILNNQGLAWIYLVTALVGGLWMFFERGVWKKLYEVRLQSAVEAGLMLGDAQKAAKIIGMREYADTMETVDSTLAGKIRNAAHNLEQSIGKK